MKRCKWYADHIDTDPEVISDSCLERQGEYQEDEIEIHFWKSGKTRCSNCKHCENKRRNDIPTLDPVLTQDWPRDEHGRLLSYWHIIDNDIILRTTDDE